MASALSRRLASEPVSKVEVHISCDKLMDRDLMSKSDPCCLLYVLTGNNWVEVHSLFLSHCFFQGHRNVSESDTTQNRDTDID